jgi:hypothetical protein
VRFLGCGCSFGGFRGGAIRNKQYQKYLGAGGTKLSKVASLLVSNGSLEQMDETRGLEAYFTGHCSTQGR